MFTDYKQLRRRTRPIDFNRADYLQALLNEYQDSTGNEDARHQVLANLVNFCYDPINFERIRELKVLALLIDCIETDENLNGNRVRLGIAGICNLLADPINREAILLDPRAVSLIVRCLSCDRHETIMSALTSLSQLVTPSSKHRIVTGELLRLLPRFAAFSNPRVKNLAKAFVMMHCPELQI